MFFFDRSTKAEKQPFINLKDNLSSKSHNLLQNKVLKRKSRIKNKEKIFDNDENKSMTDSNANRKTNHQVNDNKQKKKINKFSKGYNGLKSSLTKRKKNTEVKFDTSLHEMPSNTMEINKKNHFDESSSENNEYTQSTDSGNSSNCFNIVELSSSTTSVSDQDELSSCVYNDNSLKKLELERKWPKTDKKNRQNGLDNDTKPLYDTWKNDLAELKKIESDQIKNENRYKNKCNHVDGLAKDSSFETITTQRKKIIKKTNHKTENDKRIKKLIKMQKMKDKTTNKLIKDLNTTIKHLLLAKEKKKTSSKKNLSKKTSDSSEPNFYPNYVLSDDYQSISEDSNKKTTFVSRANSSKQKRVPIDIHIKLSQTLKGSRSNDHQSDKKKRNSYSTIENKLNFVSKKESFESYKYMKSERVQSLCTLKNKNEENTKIKNCQDFNVKLKDSKRKSLRRNQLMKANKQHTAKKFSPKPRSPFKKTFETNKSQKRSTLMLECEKHNKEEKEFDILKYSELRESYLKEKDKDYFADTPVYIKNKKEKYVTETSKNENLKNNFTCRQKISEDVVIIKDNTSVCKSVKSSSSMENYLFTKSNRQLNNKSCGDLRIVQAVKEEIFRIKKLDNA